MTLTVGSCSECWRSLDASGPLRLRPAAPESGATLAPLGAVLEQDASRSRARASAELLLGWRHRYDVSVSASRRRVELEGERPLLEVGRGGSRPPAILMLTARVRTGFHVQEVGMCAGALWGGGG